MTTLERPPVLDRRSLVTWVGAGLVVWGIIALAPLISAAIGRQPTASLVAILLWGLYGVALGFLLYRLELFRRRPIPAILGALAWGGIVVAGIGVSASPAGVEIVTALLPAGAAEWASSISAGIVEEALKTLGIVALALLPGARLRTPADGIFYGLMVGLGFMVTESFLYTVQSASGGMEAVVLTFVLRGIIGGLWNHPTYSAIAGWGVGTVAESKGKRILAGVGALLLAMILHTFFDSPLFETDPLTSTIVKGIPALVILLVLLRLARNKERNSFESVAEASVPEDLIAPDELPTLETFKARRHAQKAARKAHGRPYAHHLKRLQRAQVTLVTMTADHGPDHPWTIEAAEEVRAERAELAPLAR
ncbi:MAG: PrsW family intramembrane metalloprotease [Acidimicrobiia bacterium]